VLAGAAAVLSLLELEDAELLVASSELFDEHAATPNMATADSPRAATRFC
jgi:hypothetical protein